MIEGTKVADEFEKIYASSFYYDEDGVVLWPAQVVNYTSKTQFLFRIEKGTLDVNDPYVNNYFKPDEIRVPFRNIIYIGDSDTDIPCMKLVNTNQGHSIGVYNPKTKDKRKVYKMMRDNRIKYFAPADYSDESELDKLVKSIIDRTESNEKLEYIHYQNMNDFAEFDTLINAETKKRNDLIISLENSGSFASTHSIIAKLSVFSKWTDDEKSWLKEIKEKNSQVRLIAEDLDVDEFYKSF